MSQQSSATTGTGFIATRTINTAEAEVLPHSLRKQSLSWAKRIVSGIALTTGLSLSLLASGKAEAISFTFEKIADTNTPIPGGTGAFKDFRAVAPSLDDGNVAFLGSGGDFDPDIYDYSQPGIYTYIDRELSVVADTNTPIPSGTGDFQDFNGLSLDNENVAFSGYGGGASGIYTNISGKLNVVADNKNTPLIPTYYELISPSLDNGNVAFLGNDPTDPDFEPTDVYTYIDGNLSVIASASTPIPGSADNFGAFYSPSLDNGNVAFIGDNAYDPLATEFDNALYVSIDGKLSVIADKNTPIPGGTSNLEDVRASSLDNGNVVFVGSGRGPAGIYISIDGKLSVVADTNTPIPGSTGTFGYITSPSLDNGKVAFESYGDNFEPSSIYTNVGGLLAEVIAEGDLLDGKTVSSVFSGRESLSGKQIAFNASFKDGSQGIYVATVPEPASVLGTLAFSAFGAGWMLKRRQRKQKSGLDKQCPPQSRR